MSSPLSQAQQYGAFVACSCAATSAGYAFGFDASFVRVSVTTCQPVYLTFASTVATTGDGMHVMSTGTSSFYGPIPPTRSAAFLTTSSGAEFSLLALGY